MAAYEVLLLNTAIPQIQAAQSGDTYVVPRDIAFSTVAKLADGTAAIPALSFSTDPDTGLFSAGANILGFAANGAEKAQLSASSFILRQSSNAANTSVSFNTTVQNALTLDSSGNLGLGVPPSAWSLSGYKALEITNFGNGFYSGTNDINFVTNAYYSGGWLYGANLPATNYKTNNGVHAWYTAPSGTAGNAITFTQAMTLDASGNLVVGTTTSNGRVSISSSGSTGAYIYTAGGAGGLYIEKDYVSGVYATFKYNGVVTGTIDTSNGTNTNYNTSSDYRLKTLIGPVTDAGQRIDALKPVEFDWNVNGKRARGFFAHEFQEVYSSSVSGEKDAVDAEGNPAYQSMQASTSEVIADLVAELQSLRARVATLEQGA